MSEESSLPLDTAPTDEAPAPVPLAVRIVSPRGGQTSERVVTIQGTVAGFAGERLTLVLNGDTYLDIDYRAMIALHNRHAPQVVGTLALVEIPNSARFGEVMLAEDGRIVAFDEKVTDRDVPGLINA